MREFASSIAETAKPDAAGLLTIGEVAGRFAVTLRALRFYEDRGLIAPRRQGATRLYDQASIARLELILKGKQLGFTLSEIRDMVRAGARDVAEMPALSLARDQVEAQIESLTRRRADIEGAISELQATRDRMSMAGGAVITLSAVERMPSHAA